MKSAAFLLQKTCTAETEVPGLLIILNIHAAKIVLFVDQHPSNVGC